MAALNYFALAIRKYHDSGNMALVNHPLSFLAAFLYELGRHRPAATIAGFAEGNPFAAMTFPEITPAFAQLRSVLGDSTYESLALIGRAMTVADITVYAYDQIDQARAELDALPK